VLIRARPIAGDMGLGREFMEAISPFVWRKSLDFSEIEEIRGLKKRIDLTFSRDDIKRGYGGIREIVSSSMEVTTGGSGPTGSSTPYRC